jgi:hypothetical protein
MIPTRESNPDSPSRDAAFYTIPLLCPRAAAMRPSGEGRSLALQRFHLHYALAVTMPRPRLRRPPYSCNSAGTARLSAGCGRWLDSEHPTFKLSSADPHRSRVLAIARSKRQVFLNNDLRPLCFVGLQIRHELLQQV